MAKTICPLLRKPCIEHDCAWYTTIRGHDVNTGREIDNKQCIVTTIPLLLIENSAQQRGTNAAVESMRNEVVKKSDTTNHILANMILRSEVSELPPTPFIELPPA